MSVQKKICLRDWAGVKGSIDNVRAMPMNIIRAPSQVHFYLAQDVEVHRVITLCACVLNWSRKTRMLKNNHRPSKVALYEEP